jgi:hypothetical protein
MFNERLGDEVAGRAAELPRDFNFALGVAALSALLHTSALAAEFYSSYESRALTSGIVPRLLVLIEVCLLVNVAGLWARRPSGLLVSLAALLGAGAGYAGWYLYSRQVLGSLSSQLFYRQHPEAVPPHPFGLVGATWLPDVVKTA